MANEIRPGTVLLSPNDVQYVVFRITTNTCDPDLHKPTEPFYHCVGAIQHLTLSAHPLSAGAPRFLYYIITGEELREFDWVVLGNVDD